MNSIFLFVVMIFFADPVISPKVGEEFVSPVSLNPILLLSIVAFPSVSFPTLIFSLNWAFLSKRVGAVILIVASGQSNQLLK